MRVATIFGGVVVDIQEYEKMPVFAPSFTNIDITRYNGKVEVGYLYDGKTGAFSPDPNPPVVEPDTPSASLPPVSEYEMIQSQILINTELILLLNEL